MLLAAISEVADAEELRGKGIEVHVLRRPGLQELASKALEIRKQHPYAKLLVAGPERLVHELARRYPPLVDVELTSASATAVLAALNS